ncbi:hypothetical protein [Halocatena halophila]|uniref:hypothetical protein n=1 Tax=Halocatena halophila TaxID=2814576 RepID=UPI002ED18F9B
MIVAQQGIRHAEQVLCQSGVAIGEVVVLVIAAISAYFLLRAFYRLVNRELRGGLYSFVAGVLPLLIPAGLTIAGIETSCLLV